MAKSPELGRRAFLKGTAVLAPAAVALTTDIAGAQQKAPRDDLLDSAPAAGKPTTPHYHPTFFSPPEWAFVCAAVDRLIPRDDVGPGALELGVAEYIDRQMGTPWAEGARWYMQAPFVKAEPEFGYQSKLTPKEQYRLCIPAINDYCRHTFNGQTFAELDPGQKDTVLKAIEDGKVEAKGVNLKTFFSSFLLKNTIEGYFGDPMYGGNKDMGAWKMIKYPGVRADYYEWATQRRPYPYGPVNLHGRSA